MKHWTKHISGFLEFNRENNSTLKLTWKNIRNFWNRRHEKRKIYFLNYPNKSKQR